MTELQEHFVKVYRFALSLSRHHQTAEDIAQECMLKALKFERESQPSLPIAWYFQVARNLWVDRVKSADVQRRVAYDESELGVRLPKLSSIEDREEVALVLSAMNRLPDQQRQVLYLRSVEEMTTREIAEVMQMTVSNVKTTLSLARKKMRELCDRILDTNKEVRSVQ